MKRKKTIYDMFADAEQAYETWRHESMTRLGYPSFHEWVYMTPGELWDSIDPISGYHVTCASCTRKDCRHWCVRVTCPVPELYEPSQAVLESRRAKAAEYVRQMTRGSYAAESERTSALLSYAANLLSQIRDGMDAKDATTGPEQSPDLYDVDGLLAEIRRRYPEF